VHRARSGRTSRGASTGYSTPVTDLPCVFVLGARRAQNNFRSSSSASIPSGKGIAFIENSCAEARGCGRLFCLGRSSTVVAQQRKTRASAVVIADFIGTAAFVFPFCRALTWRANQGSRCLTRSGNLNAKPKRNRWPPFLTDYESSLLFRSRGSRHRHRFAFSTASDGKPAH